MTPRLPLIGLLIALGGCPNSALEGDSIGDPPPGQGVCEDDFECIPAGASCCDCPTFALPTASGWAESCEDVSCDVPGNCPATEAVCYQGSCILRCRPIQCEITCESGFATDEFGCLLCPASADDCPTDAPTAPGCEFDSDCVQVPADCCGCGRGGADTAVLAAEVDDFLGGYDCGDTQVCPEVDVCDPDMTPRCLAGICQLGAQPLDYNGDAGVGCEGTDGGCEDGVAPQYCGAADYPACPDGQVCVLNDPDANEANQSGVGVCQPG